ncbi:MAG TPA: hypothetical protein VIV11_40735 [Kofleriaceae bacterium]
MKLRKLPEPQAVPYTVDDNDRVDLVAQRRYGEATRYWHVADANTELDARELCEPGRVITVPEHS